MKSIAPETKEKVIALYEANVPYRKIYELTGLQRNCVIRLLRLEGKSFKPRKLGRPPLDRGLIEKMLKQMALKPAKQTWREFSEVHGYEENTVKLVRRNFIRGKYSDVKLPTNGKREQNNKQYDRDFVVKFLTDLKQKSPIQTWKEFGEAFGYDKNQLYWLKTQMALGKYEDVEGEVDAAWASGKSPEEIRRSLSGDSQKTIHDPRSEACKALSVCSHDTCYLHNQCPAYQAYKNYRGSA
jgi:hypothetical protein